MANKRKTTPHPPAQHAEPHARSETGMVTGAAADTRPPAARAQEAPASDRQLVSEKGAEIDITGEKGSFDLHRTGVGTPDDYAEAGGMALGGDTGDVGTPRDSLGGDAGSTHGTSDVPQGSSVRRPEERTPKTGKPRGRKAA